MNLHDFRYRHSSFSLINKHLFSTCFMHLNNNRRMVSAPFLSSTKSSKMYFDISIGNSQQNSGKMNRSGNPFNTASAHSDPMPNSSTKWLYNFGASLWNLIGNSFLISLIAGPSKIKYCLQFKSVSFMIAKKHQKTISSLISPSSSSGLMNRHSNATI